VPGYTWVALSNVAEAIARTSLHRQGRAGGSVVNG